VLSSLKQRLLPAASLLVFVQWASLAFPGEAVKQEVIEEAQGKAEESARQYAWLVKEALAKAKNLSAAKSPSRCPVSQGCFGRKVPSGPGLFKQEASPVRGSESLPQPIVFVSSSMPETALQGLALEARKYQAKLVIRGMVNNSMKDTGNFVRRINHPVDIDPKLFKKYGVSQVPAFAVPCQARDQQDREGKPWTEWRIVRGNVKLAFAIEKARGREDKPNDLRGGKEPVAFSGKESRQ